MDGWIDIWREIRREEGRERWGWGGAIRVFDGKRHTVKCRWMCGTRANTTLAKDERLLNVENIF